MSYNELRKGRVSLPGQEYFITTVVRNRRPVFLDFPSARLCIAALRESEQGGEECRWLAWVLMPDHFHGLLSLGEKGKLSRVVNHSRGAVLTG